MKYCEKCLLKPYNRLNINVKLHKGKYLCKTCMPKDTNGEKEK